MSPKERAEWQSVLSRSTTQDDAIESILDRVEQLERELAAARAAYAAMATAIGRSFQGATPAEDTSCPE
jgi:hypothetical protein